MPGFNIIRVVGQDPKQASAIFRRVISEETAKSILTSQIQRVANLGLAAAKSAVPVRTKELRNAIKLGGVGSLEREVYIEASIHQSSKTNLKLNNPTLAEILDEGEARRVGSKQVIRSKKRRFRKHGKFMRNFDSIGLVPFYSIRKGSPTAHWITEARRNIREALKR